MADQEQIDYQIRIEAAEALKSLEGIVASASSMPEVIQAVETELQKLSDKFGISLGAAQAEFQNTIQMAKNLRDTMEELKAQGAEDMVSFSPYLQNLSAVNSPFGEMGDAAGWRAVLDARREADALARDQIKSEAAIAKELNAQAMAAEKAAAARAENLKAAQQEQAAVEKEGAALQQQLSMYGQVSRTAAQAAQYLRSFAGTEQGQSILTKFFGSYQEAQGVAQQINVVKSSILELSKTTGTTFAQSAKVFQEQFSSIPGIAQQTNTAVKELNSEFDKTPQKTGQVVRGLDAVRIALGAIVAMIVFQVIQAFQNFFREVIDGAKQVELAINGIENAERVLSNQGIGIKPSDFQEIIDKLKVLNPLLSDLQATDIVSTVAGKLGVALGLNKQQIDQYAQVVAIYAAKNIEFGKSVDETLNDMVNAALSGRVSQGINDMGIKITDATVKTEAFRLANIKSEEEWNNLTAEQQNYNKFLALSNILMESAQAQQGGIAGKLDTIAGASSELSKEWSNFTSELGKLFGPQIITGLKILTSAIQGWIGMLNFVKKPLMEVIALQAAFMQTLVDPNLVQNGFIATFEKKLETIKRKYEELQGAIDTPTGLKPKVDTSEAIQDLDKLKQKIEDIMQDTANAREDLQKNMNEKLADLDLEYQRKGEDAYRDYLRKLEDIDQDYVDDVAKIKKKQREDDQNDEAKYQLALWELQQKYLMDLEDALHARDARQILRLQRQYAFDKEDAARKHALDTKQREQSQRDELDAAKKKRDQAIQDAQIEYQRKLADQRVAKQRELDDLNTWYAREQADIETAQQRKLETLLKGWIDEQKITQQNAQAVYDILKGYFGPGGMTDQLYQYMMQSLINNTAAAVSALSGVGIGGGTTGGRTGGGGGSVGSKTGSTGHGGTRSRAEGGTMIATRPTNVTFGEAGAEAALFLPLSHLGRNAGSVDLSGNVGGGMDGRLVIRLDLSPDLEARVVENSMNGVADIITQINRSKI